MAETLVLDKVLKKLHRQDASSAREPRTRRKKHAKRSRPSPLRHDRKCSVCHRPERAETIAEEHGIAHHSANYRHSHIVRLFAQRATHICILLAPIIERAIVVPATPDSVVRAAIACAHLNDHGEWVNPAKTVVRYRSEAAPPESSGRERNAEANPNRETLASRT